MAKRQGLVYWQKHLEACKQSELTQKAYCAQHGLSTKSFYRPLCTVPSYVHLERVNPVAAIQDEAGRFSKVHIIPASSGKRIVCPMLGIDGARCPTPEAGLEPIFPLPRHTQRCSPRYSRNQDCIEMGTC